MCVTMLNFVVIGRTVAEIVDCLIFKMTAIHHLRFVVRLLGPPT